jgi:thioredoxin 1
MINTLTYSNFAEEIFTSSKPSVVEFYAPWCDSCIEFENDLNTISDSFNNIINFFKVNIDDEPDLADRFMINKLPTFILFKDRQIKNSIIGTPTPYEFKMSCNNLLA